VENTIGTQVMTTWIERAIGSEFRREHSFVEPVNEEKGKPVNILRMAAMSRVKMIPKLSDCRAYRRYKEDVFSL